MQIPYAADSTFTVGTEAMCWNITLHLSETTWEKSNDSGHIKLWSNKEVGKWRDGEVGSGGGTRKHKAWVNTARSASGTN